MSSNPSTPSWVCLTGYQPLTEEHLLYIKQAFNVTGELRANELTEEVLG